MARPPRLELAGVPLHIIQRGVNRAACFFGDVDRRFYLKCLGKFAARRGCLVHTYVLMANHVHLLVTPREKGAAAAMLMKSSLVDTETYFLTCHRYIELNPVRAGMMEHIQTAVGRNVRLPRRGRPPKSDAAVAATEVVSGKLL